MCKVDIVAVIHIEKIAIAIVGIAVQVYNVVPHDDGFFFRSSAGTKFEYLRVIGGRDALNVHDVVLKKAVVPCAIDVDGVVVALDVVFVVDEVAPDGHMVGKGDVDRLAALIGEGAVFHDKAVIVLIDDMALIV